MNTKIISIADVIEHLKFFSEDVVEYFPPIDKQHIVLLEDELSIKLPQDYIDFLLVSNGMSLMGNEILGISVSNGNYGLMEVYKFEHFDVGNPMPKKLVPFMPDGFGNHYCFDTINGNVVFWEHDCCYDTYLPSIICKSFSQFVQCELIDNILKDYDYEGNPL